MSLSPVEALALMVAKSDLWVALEVAVLDLATREPVDEEAFRKMSDLLEQHRPPFVVTPWKKLRKTP